LVLGILFGGAVVRLLEFGALGAVPLIALRRP
jgi:hypothetical protein